MRQLNPSGRATCLGKQLIIPLPTVTVRPGAAAHAYPFQVGMQTLQFLQASILYVVLQDMASGAFVRQPGAIESLEKGMLASGGDQASIGLGWKFLGEYMDVFRDGVFQATLIVFNSHWDWYIGKIAAFILTSMKHVHIESLAKKEETDLRRVGYLGIIQQLDLLEKASATTFSLDQDDRERLREMSLVRNLGLHNRWEVDERYLALSKCKKYGKNHLRSVDHVELTEWHECLVRAVNETTTKIAQSFSAAPPFCHI